MKSIKQYYNGSTLKVALDRNDFLKNKLSPSAVFAFK